MTGTGVRLSPLSGDDPAALGAYRLVGRLASGGMGRIYLARDSTRGDRPVAVKTLLAEGVVSDTDRRRFAREVALAKRVDSAYTAKVLDADPQAERPWMAIDYIAAPSLAELVRDRGVLPARAVRWVAAETARALETLHRAGVVHRDVKPQNVLLPLSGPRLIDFGISHATDATRTMLTLGTIAFTSPEQARGEPSTAASDVYALGATLFHLAVGRPPYPEGEDTLRLLARVSRGDLDLTGLPGELLPVIRPCLAVDPAGRPSPAGLRELLLTGPDGEPAPGGGARLLPGPWTDLIDAYERQGRALRQGAGAAVSGEAPTVDQRTRGLPPPDPTRLYTNVREEAREAGRARAGRPPAGQRERAGRARADRQQAMRARADRQRAERARIDRAWAAPAAGRDPGRDPGRTAAAPQRPEGTAGKVFASLLSALAVVSATLLAVLVLVFVVVPALSGDDGSGPSPASGSSYRPTRPAVPPRTPSAEELAFAAVRSGDCLSSYDSGYKGWSTRVPVRVDCSAGDAHLRVTRISDSLLDCPSGPGRHYWLHASVLNGSRVFCVSRQFREGQCFVAERSGDRITDARLLNIWNCDADEVPVEYNTVLRITGYYRKPSECRESAYDRNVYWQWEVDDGRSILCVTSA